MVYWVDTTILPPGDPEEQRPVVVLDVPATVDGTVVVVARSGGRRLRRRAPRRRRWGSAPGRFSRRHPVQGRLWTAAHVTPVGPLDDGVWAAVVGPVPLR